MRNGRIALASAADARDKPSIFANPPVASPIAVPRSSCRLSGFMFSDRSGGGVEQQLFVVQAAAIVLIDADGHHHARPTGRLIDYVGRRRGHRHGLAEQSQMRGPVEILQWRPYQGKIWV